MTLLKLRDPKDPFRKKYRLRLIETGGLIVAMFISLAIWLVNFASYELDQIWASDSLRVGFCIMLTITALLMVATLVWAFRARAALNSAGYETVKDMSAV